MPLGKIPNTGKLSSLYERGTDVIDKSLKIDGDKDILQSDRELKINSPNTSNDAARQNFVTADTEQELPQERLNPFPTTMSNLRNKKKNRLYSDADIKLKVGAKKLKTDAIGRLASAIEDRNILEAERKEILKKRNDIEQQKLQAFKEFADIFSSFVNK